MHSMPLIIAHRGASAYAPENTLAAFELAHQQGADMLELDVQRTSDGHLVVFHDPTTARWDPSPRPVSTCTLADLRTLDIDGEPVATLAEVCAFAHNTGMMLNVELKQANISAQTVMVLRDHAIAERVIISSFYATALKELQQIAPDIRRAYLMGTQTYRLDVRAREFWPFLALQQVRATAWHPAYQLPALRQVLPLVRRAGYAVNVWTVDDPPLMQRLVAWGATGIITNRPDVARYVLGRNRS